MAAPPAREAHQFIADLDEIDLRRFRVVGAYTRYDEAVRNALQDARQRIIAGFESPGRKRENHLIWAAPGSGKTYFVQQIAAELPNRIPYHEVNLAQYTEAELRTTLGALDNSHPCLCLLDEIDAKPQEPWPYEVLLPYLDAAVEREARFAFVMAGSSGANLDEIKQRIAARPKGADLLSRIPPGNEYIIEAIGLGDRILIVLTQLRQAAEEMGRDIRAVEKLGLYYVALNPTLGNARKLREFAVRAVGRVPSTDNRVKYDHLFMPGDPENKAFWVQAQTLAGSLANTFATLTRERAMEHRAPRMAAGLPSGTVTLLFTDIEGSTTLLQRLGDRRYAEVLDQHQRLLRAAFAEGHGEEIDTQGDAFLVAFSRARDAVGAAVAAQRALLGHVWPDGASLRVRMGLHTGEPLSGGRGYVGIDVHRAARIAAAGHGGQILISDAVSGLAARDLPPGVRLRDLGTQRLKDLREPEHLFQVVHPDLATDFPPLKSLDVLPNNLPVQLTSFIGREREITDVKRLLKGTRLLTLVGVGGVGKTRLALQAATEVLEDYPDGVWISELAAVSNPSLVPQTVAAIFHVQEMARHQFGRPVVDMIAEDLRGKRLLLVLDNCEHLVAACAELADVLLRSCPELRILATSRERIGIAGEIAWQVPSLSLPGSDSATIEGILSGEAVHLFAERARAATPAFALTEQNAPVVAQLCQRLDGIPLAIELAAARVKVFPVEQIAKRLDLRLLTGGSRTALPRHQTLRATLDWSYSLLARVEQTLLHRLSVFTGGFTLEAAEAVCAGNGINELNVAELLTQLIEKSLAVMEQQRAEGRYRLLETVRQYAREKLLASGEVESVSLRHLEFFLALAKTLEDTGPDMTFDSWLERMQADQGNLGAALDWSLEGDHAEAGLRLATTLWRFWFHRARLSEGRATMGRALAKAKDAPTLLRARALNAASFFALWQDGMEEALALCDQSLPLSREAGDAPTTALSLAIRGHALWHLGQQGNGEALCDEAVSLARQTRDKQTLLATLRELAYVAWHNGDFEHRAGSFEEYLTLSRALGNKSAIIDSVRFVGEVALNRKDYVRAVHLYEESLALSRIANDTLGTAQAQISLGNALEAQAQYGRAGTFYRESLPLFRQVNNKWWFARCLEGLTRVEVERFGPLKATRLFGAAEALREASGGAPPPLDQALNARVVPGVSDAQGEDAFTAAWAEGRAMTLEQAIEYALTPESS